MQYDSLITWKELSDKVDANEPLDPVEQFIYDNEPCAEGDTEWRRRFQEALYFFGRAPRKNKEPAQQHLNREVIMLEIFCVLFIGGFIYGFFRGNKNMSWILRSSLSALFFSLFFISIPTLIILEKLSDAAQKKEEAVGTASNSA